MENNKQQNRRRQNRARSRSDQTPWARTICKAPRLDNRQLMEEHFDQNKSGKKSEFLDLWMDQLEETTRQLPHESLLQRVLELENELLETQEKLKKANKDLLRSNQGGTSQVVSAPSSPLYCASPRHQANQNSPLYHCSPIYQSPRLISPSAE